MIAVIVILKNGHLQEKINAAGGRAIFSIVSAISILIAEGALIGTWNMSGIADVDHLLPKGGMDNMLLALWIIIGAVTFGALMEESGLLAKLINPVLLRTQTVGSLFVTVTAIAVWLNIAAGDQYIALVLPARLFRGEFQKRGLQSQNLLQTTADSGTLTSILIPWSSCGAYMVATLDVATFLYLPFTIFNITNLILSLLYRVTGFNIGRMPSTTQKETLIPPT